MRKHEQLQPNSVDPVFLELLEQPSLQQFDDDQVADWLVQSAVAAYEDEAARFIALSDGVRSLAEYVGAHGLEEAIKQLRAGKLPSESAALQVMASAPLPEPEYEPLKGSPDRKDFADWEALLAGGKSPAQSGPRNIPRRPAVTPEDLETDPRLRGRVAGHLSAKQGHRPVVQQMKKYQEHYGLTDETIDGQVVRETVSDMLATAEETRAAVEAGEFVPADHHIPIVRDVLASVQSTNGQHGPSPNGSSGLPT